MKDESKQSSRRITIDDEQERKLLEPILLDAMQSGEATPITDAYWKKIAKDGIARSTPGK